jgi:hypothetical protein
LIALSRTSEQGAHRHLDFDSSLSSATSADSCVQRAFLTPSATTFHQMLGSSGSIKKWRKHQRVGENIEKNSLKMFKIYLQKNNKEIQIILKIIIQ